MELEKPTKYQSDLLTNHRFYALVTVAVMTLLVLALLSREVVFSTRDQSQSVTIHVKKFIDRSANLSVQQLIRAPYAKKFVVHEGVPNFGYTAAAVWLHLRIENPRRDTLVLKINNPLIDSIQLYQKSLTDATWSLTHEVGSALSRPIQHRFFYLDLGEASSAERSTVLLRLQSRDTMLVAPLAVFDRQDLIEDTSEEAIKNGLYYGLVGIMITYNLLLWMFLRERVYAVYSVFIAAFALLQLSSDGYFLLWFEHNIGGWKTWFNAFAADISLVAMMIYARCFLESSKYAPSLDRVAIALIALGVVAALFVPFGRYELMLNTASLLNALSVPILIGLGVTALRRGYSPARFFLVGYSFLLLALIFVSLAMIGVLPASAWHDLKLEHVMKFGAAFEIMFFSFALAERIQVMHRNSQNAQEALLAAEKKRHESYELAARMAAKVEQSEAIARMTQTLAHDVRKPFSMLKMGLDRLALPGFDPATQKITLQKIREHVGRAFDHVNGMISDILEISSQQSALQREDIAFQKLLMLALTQVFCRDHKNLIQFEYDFDSHLVVRVDERKFLRVLINILENARQAMPQGGRIWIQGRIADLEGRRHCLHFVIRNSGSYIPSEDLAKIFEAFFTQGKRGGTGLGLAICKKVITDHGGEIECRSSIELGTEFSFSLPAPDMDVLAEANADQPRFALPTDNREIRDRVEASIGANVTITSGTSIKERLRSLETVAAMRSRPLQVLLIDDETEYLTQITTLAENAGVPTNLVEFTTASSAERGLAIAQSLPVDLIVCDVDFGSDEKNGFDLIRDLRSMGNHVQICIHSNRCTPEDYRQGFAAGADVFLPKPMTAEHLLSLMASLHRAEVQQAG